MGVSIGSAKSLPGGLLISIDEKRRRKGTAKGGESGQPREEKADSQNDCTQFYLRTSPAKNPESRLSLSLLCGRSSSIIDEERRRLDEQAADKS
jgi:hypothetical protein